MVHVQVLGQRLPARGQDEQDKEKDGETAGEKKKDRAVQICSSSKVGGNRIIGDGWEWLPSSSSCSSPMEATEEDDDELSRSSISSARSGRGKQEAAAGMSRGYFGGNLSAIVGRPCGLWQPPARRRRNVNRLQRQEWEAQDGEEEEIFAR